VDLRPSSISFKQVCKIELSPKLNNSVYIPRGCAHGYLTLQDQSEILYCSSAAHSITNESGINLMDPSMQYLDVELIKKISKKDAQLQSLGEFLDSVGASPEWYV